MTMDSLEMDQMLKMADDGQGEKGIPVKPITETEMIGQVEDGGEGDQDNNKQTEVEKEQATKSRQQRTWRRMVKRTKRLE